jgi:hypothetical protein
MPIAREFDSPWKEALELFLEPFLHLFCADLHGAIDWSKGYVSLDKELQQIVHEAEAGAALADKLFRVSLREGDDVLLLIHVEVQAQADGDFPRRMFVYYYRITDRYNDAPVSLAVLGDDRANWRPDEYVRERFGCKLSLAFRTIKLLDWLDLCPELEASANPAALVVVAHLESLVTGENQEVRRQAKWRLIRRLYELGWNAEQFRQMYRLIDWFLKLPDELQRRLQDDIHEYEKEIHMPYVTSGERMAKEEGERTGLMTALTVTLQEKFGESGLSYSRELQAVLDTNKLLTVLKAIVNAPTIEDLRNLVK